MTPSVGFAPQASDARLAASLFQEAARRSPDVAGISRPAFSAKETEILEWLRAEAEGMGLCTWYDAGQNLRMCLPEDALAERFVLVGSHVDSVPMGGNYDGLAGVLAGLICLARARSTGERFARPVQVIAMRAEESAWFGPCYIASKALTGALSAQECAALHRGDHRPLGDHMRDFGIDMNRVQSGLPLIDLDQVLGYVELHIEQGPMLIGKGSPAAVVTGIRGNFRHRDVCCSGQAGHSGAVPRVFRRDPVMAMSDLLMRLDDAWASIIQKGEDLVLTSGIVHTDAERNAMTRIADEVRFSLDIRSQSSDVLEGMQGLLSQEMAQIERERRVSFALDACHWTAPAMMDAGLVEDLSASMQRIGLPVVRMASGGGHDAAVFANAGIPSAMVFVRNRNGSHNPDEAMEIDDFLSGVEIIYDMLKQSRSVGRGA